MKKYSQEEKTGQNVPFGRGRLLCWRGKRKGLDEILSHDFKDFRAVNPDEDEVRLIQESALPGFFLPHDPYIIYAGFPSISMWDVHFVPPDWIVLTESESNILSSVNCWIYDYDSISKKLSGVIGESILYYDELTREENMAKRAYKNGKLVHDYAIDHHGQILMNKSYLRFIKFDSYSHLERLKGTRGESAVVFLDKNGEGIKQGIKQGMAKAMVILEKKKLGDLIIIGIFLLLSFVVFFQSR